MNTCKKVKACAVLALLATSVCAYATTDAPVDETVTINVAKLPPKHQQGNVTYVSGGIGKEETKVMRGAETRYPLTLEFAQYAKPHDEYLADIKVKVTDRTGKLVLDTTSTGPILLTKLPNGQYKVSAENDKGKIITKHVAVNGAEPERVVLVWPKSEHGATQKVAQLPHQTYGTGS